MKNYYELLGVARDVPADEIKRAFRKEIARYHPDKVQHLGPEFQEIATVRAAELTEAYRVLMNEAARQRYDEDLSEGGGTTPPPATRGRAPGAAPSTPDAPIPEARPETPPTERHQHPPRTASTDFVRKATLARLRDAITAVSDAEEVTAHGLDLAYEIKAKGGLFRKSEPAVRLLAKFVPQADVAAVEAVWPLAANAGVGGEVVCLLLLGGGLIAPARELSVAVSELRRKARVAGPVLIPVDVRDWEALFPPEAPASVRGILQRLREGQT